MVLAGVRVPSAPYDTAIAPPVVSLGDRPRVALQLSRGAGVILAGVSVPGAWSASQIRFFNQDNAEIMLGSRDAR